jgi:transposase
MIPNIKENPRHRKTTKRGRKRFFNEAIHALRMHVERTFAWEAKGSSINNSYNFVKCPIMLLWKRPSWKRSFEKNLLPWRQ